MKNVETTETVILENNKRVLYEITQEYNGEARQNLGYDSYKGYYVENKVGKIKKAQAYRLKTIKDGVETIEDAYAFLKAKETFYKGFNF